MQRKGLYAPPAGASDIPGLEIAARWWPPGRGRALQGGRPGVRPRDRRRYAEYCTTSALTALPIPEGLSAIEAAALPETFFTVWSNVFDRGRLQPGEVLLVHGGTSGIGTTAIQLAKAFGSKVFVTVGSAEKCEAARKLGADLASTTTPRTSWRGEERDRRQGRQRDPRHGGRRLYRPQL